MHTKIIATLGPATSDEDSVRSLVEAGARIFRLNFSHGGKEGFIRMVDIIRGLERKLGQRLRPRPVGRPKAKKGVRK